MARDDCGLARHLVPFVIDLETRPVVITGISRSPDVDWATQLARNLTDRECGLLVDAPFLISDRDPLFTEAFENAARGSAGYSDMIGWRLRPRPIFGK